MRKKIIAGNWKMNKEMADALSLVRGVRDTYTGTNTPNIVDIVLCPPFPFLAMAANELQETSLSVGGQDLHQEEHGAYTGEVSGPALHSVGCTYVIIGHSERRTFFHETDDVVNAKLQAALKSGLRAIVCIGETLEERESGTTFQVIDRQVRGAFGGIPEQALENIVLAYEPVWAIGTGKTASPDQAQEVHAHIRALLVGMYSHPAADAMRIQYGGSMKPANAEELLRQPDVDGGLIGGACLQADTFAAIIDAAAAITGELG